MTSATWQIRTLVYCSCCTQDNLLYKTHCERVQMTENEQFSLELIPGYLRYGT